MVFLDLNPGPADKQPLKFWEGVWGSWGFATLYKKLPQLNSALAEGSK
jgi:hypothetical protein